MKKKYILRGSLILGGLIFLTLLVMFVAANSAKSNIHKERQDQKAQSAMEPLKKDEARLTGEAGTEKADFTPQEADGNTQTIVTSDYAYEDGGAAEAQNQTAETPTVPEASMAPEASAPQETPPEAPAAVSDAKASVPDQSVVQTKKPTTDKAAGATVTEEKEDDTYQYVALGNSVTCNTVSDLWWGSFGMAATSEEKDYVHIIESWLKTSQPLDVKAEAVGIKDWEVASDRDKVLDDVIQHISADTDLITIQTGENITDNKSALYDDYNNLFSHVKKKAPNAKIVVIGEVLWPSEDIETAKRQACENNSLPFIDMTEFLTGYEGSYRSALNTVVKGDDGNTHTIANEVVAAHPNDEGMAKIAQLIINQLSSQ